MTSGPNTTEPDTHPDADDDPQTETPDDGEGTPTDNPSGSFEGTLVEPEDQNASDQGNDPASGGS